MSEPLSPDRPWKLLTDLRRLVAERPPAEAGIASSFTTSNKEIEKEYQQVQSDLAQRYEQEVKAVEADHAAERRAIAGRFESDHGATQHEYDEVRSGALKRFQTAETKAKQQFQEARWEATTVFEATKDGPDMRLAEVSKQLDGQWQHLQAVGQGAVRLLQKRRQWREYPAPQAAGPWAEDDPMRRLPDYAPRQRFSELATQANRQLGDLASQTVARLFEGAQPIGILIFLWLIAIYPSGLAMGWQGWHWIAVSVGVAMLIWLACGIWFYRIAKRQSTEIYLALCTTLAEADLARQGAINTAKAECEQQRAEIAERLENELKRAEEVFSETIDRLKETREAELAEAESKYPSLLADTVTRRDDQLRQAHAEYSGKLDEINDRYQS